MQIKILGSTAGGGFPQWNYACRDCREMRAGKLNPIVGVVPTGGDLDQVLGLPHLRELEPIHTYATASIRRLLREQNILFNMLTSRLGKASGRILCREKGSRS